MKEKVPPTQARVRTDPARQWRRGLVRLFVVVATTALIALLLWSLLY